MKAIIAISLLLVGCSTVPVEPAKFPDIPPSLTQSCPQLDLVPVGTEKLSEVLSIVSKNYGKYHECSALVDAWKLWYDQQRQIRDKK